jgi:hypothetical protein
LAAIDREAASGDFPHMSSDDVTRKYHAEGYAHLRDVTPPDVARSLLGFISRDLAQSGKTQKALRAPAVNTKPAYELHSYQYAPLMGFHWGLTSRMCEVTGAKLLPTYGFFRVYQRNDICTVHTDRPSCEHSLSMPLAYGDGIVWSIEVGKQEYDFDAACKLEVANDFGGEEYRGLLLDPGDALLYKGVNKRHGRMTPNPNSWSAHVFLHWIDTEGPFKEWAFDRAKLPQPGGFFFPPIAPSAAQGVPT